MLNLAYDLGILAKIFLRERSAKLLISNSGSAGEMRLPKENLVLIGETTFTGKNFV